MTSLDTGPAAGTFHEISRGRRAKNVVAGTVVTAAFLLALLPLTWILFNVVTKGFKALTTVAWWSRSQNGILPEQVGGGVYHETLSTEPNDDHTNFGTNIGGGVKITLAGPIRLRLDYRVFSLRGTPRQTNAQRLYAGINLKF